MIVHFKGRTDLVCKVVVRKMAASVSVSVSTSASNFMIACGALFYLQQYLCHKCFVTFATHTSEEITFQSSLS